LGQHHLPNQSTLTPDDNDRMRGNLCLPFAPST
jgi:hypothetical protein